MSRIFLTTIFFISVLFGPWWVTVPIAIILIAYFKAYVEALVGGIFMDGLFSAPINPVFGTEFLYTFIFLSLILLAFFSRKVMME